MEGKQAEARRRAKKCRSKDQNKRIKEEERARVEATEGLTRQEYWSKYVKSREDVIRFYQLYNPEYPQHLVDAIATRLEKLIQKCKDGQPLTDQEVSYFREKESLKWDPKEEMKEEENKGKIAVAMKRLDELQMDQV